MDRKMLIQNEHFINLCKKFNVNFIHGYIDYSNINTNDDGIGNISIIITNKCNLNCSYCHSFIPAIDNDYVDITLVEYEKIINRLHTLFGNRIKYFNILGGEPLLRKDLDSIIYITRKYFSDNNCTKISISTNGILINKIPQKTLDIFNKYKIGILLSLYPISIDLNEIKNICLKNNIKLSFYNRNKMHKFNLLHHKIKNNLSCIYLGYNDIGKIDSFPSTYIDKDGYMSVCPILSNMKYINKKFKLNFEFDETDYMNIYINNSNNIMNFIKSKHNFCDYCMGIYKDYYKWCSNTFSIDNYFYKDVNNDK